MTLMEILTRLARPRPNHSDALADTASYIGGLLRSWDIPFIVQQFPLRPHMHAIVGITCLALTALLLVLVVKRKWLPAVIAALAVPVLMLVEFELLVPTVSALFVKTGENIIVRFPVEGAARELIFCAHYDSKTEFLDHLQRTRLYQFLPLFFLLGILLGPLVLWGKRLGTSRGRIVQGVAVTLASLYMVYMSLVALNFGGYVFPIGESSGAVDNGTAVTSLLGLAREMREGRVARGRSSVTIVFTAGEEVNFQGAIHYVDRYIRGVRSPVPRYCVNLELMAQGGDMIYWKRSGVFLRFRDADRSLAARMGDAWRTVSGRPMGTEDHSADDSVAFMAAGVPTVTVGFSGRPGPGMGGFHSPADSIGRVKAAQLPQAVATFRRFIESYGNR
ncbi:MAG: M28 family peptidase [Spirochaetes bacterium]|nr:M28 family peptidase [Spirochaetota bacterium]